MNNFEVVKILDRMLSTTRTISVETRLCFINEALLIDKNNH